MELRQLQTFLTLSELNSFTKTASELGYAQSNITAQIKQLEQELGGQLFNRLGHSVTLTEKGHKLVPYATKLLALSKEAIATIAVSPHNIISIIASESLCTYRLPLLLGTFRQNHPEVEFHIQLLNNDNFYDSLVTGQADIAYTLQQEVSQPYVKELLISPEIIGSYAIPEYPLAKKKSLTTHDFNGIPLILTGAGCCYRAAFLNELLSSNVTPNIILETSSLQVIKEMTLSGIGVCVLPQMAVIKELKEGKLIQLPYEMNYGFASQLMIHKDKVCSTSLQDFTDFAQIALHSSSIC